MNAIPTDTVTDRPTLDWGGWVKAIYDQQAAQTAFLKTIANMTKWLFLLGVVWFVLWFILNL